MTEDDARTVLTIMVSADSYCSVCARNLFRRFIAIYPQFKPMADEIFHVQTELRDAERDAIDNQED